MNLSQIIGLLDVETKKNDNNKKKSVKEITREYESGENYKIYAANYSIPWLMRNTYLIKVDFVHHIRFVMKTSYSQ